MFDATTRKLACRDHVLEALLAAAQHRKDHDDWVDRERRAVAEAATDWSAKNAGGRLITVNDVERLESFAVGHVDYASKLALYVAELVTEGAR